MDVGMAYKCMLGGCIELKEQEQDCRTRDRSWDLFFQLNQLNSRIFVEHGTYSSFLREYR